MLQTALIALALIHASPIGLQDGGTVYFPRSTPAESESAGISAFQAEWFSRHLAAAEEPALYPADAVRKKGGTLRFTWLRSFHAPVIVRVEGLDGDAPRLVAKQLSGRGGYAPGKVAKRIARSLTPVEAEALRATFRRTAIFTTPPPPETLGTDGAQWVFEGVDAAGYRLLDRWTPQAGSVRDMGLAMLALTGWKLGAIY